jgi:hypothetical protein
VIDGLMNLLALAAAAGAIAWQVRDLRALVVRLTERVGALEISCARLAERANLDRTP